MKHSSSNTRYNPPAKAPEKPSKAPDKATTQALAAKIRDLARQHPEKAARILTAWIKKSK